MCNDFQSFEPYTEKIQTLITAWVWVTAKVKTSVHRLQYLLVCVYACMYLDNYYSTISLLTKVQPTST